MRYSARVPKVPAGQRNPRLWPLTDFPETQSPC